MIKRIFTSAIQLTAGLLAGVMVMLALAFWQLSKGPISLTFLSPYIEDVVNEENNNYRLEMGDTILTWAGWERAFDLRLLNVSVFGPGGALIGNVPEVAFAISGDALLEGNIAPNSIELFGPRLEIIRDRDGTIGLGFGGQVNSRGTMVQKIVDNVFGNALQSGQQNYLSRLDIVGANLTIKDQVLARAWQAPAVDIRFDRGQNGIAGEVSLVLDLDGINTEISVAGVYQSATSMIDLKVNFSEMSPAVFASLYPELESLKILNLPLKGQAILKLSAAGEVRQVDFDLSGGVGALVLPGKLKQSLAVENVMLRGRFNGDNKILFVDKMNINFPDNSVFELPQPYKHSMPLRRVDLVAKVDFAGNVLDLEKLIIDLDGPVANIDGRVTGLLQSPPNANDNTKMVAKLNGRLEKATARDAARYWPKTVAKSVREWIIKHIPEGTINSIDSQVTLSSVSGKSIKVAALNGAMSITDGVVDYLPPAPAVNNVIADITFDDKQFDIKINQGRSQKLSIDGGRILISGLDQYDQIVEVNLPITGSVQDELLYIDKPPFGFASQLKIDPKTASGQAKTDLKLKFIAEDALTRDQIDIKARARLTGVGLSAVFLGRDVTEGELDLLVDKTGMDVRGDVVLGQIPARLSWRENFLNEADFRSQYQVIASIPDVNQLTDIGLGMDPFTGKYIKGGVAANIRYTVLDDVDSRLEVRADLRSTKLSFPSFSWTKKIGDVGAASVVINLENKTISDIPDFSIAANDLRIQGSARYKPKGAGVEKIDFSQFIFGRTDMKGALIARDDGGWDAGFSGKSFDLSPIWVQMVEGNDSVSRDKQFLLPKLSLSVELDKVWFKEDRLVSNVSGTFAYENDFWQTMLLKSVIGSDTNFELQVVPNGAGGRLLTMRSDNAGETLKTLDYYDKMIGGKLNITGTFDDTIPGRPLTGVMEVSNFRVVKAPVFTRVISLMALTGILEALDGEGLAFDTLNVPFSSSDGVFTIKDGRASGVSLGFTASGKVYTAAELYDLKGTMVPAYALNSALGNIPLLGQLLTGSEKGGGVFAVNYSIRGPVEKPTINVNPLSALAPGILRNIFGLFTEADPIEGLPKLEGLVLP